EQRMENPNCPKCQSEETVKNGFLKEKQRFKCKKCKFNFSTLKRRGKSETIKSLAISIHAIGASFRATGKLLKVSAQSVINWVEKHVKELPAKSFEEDIKVIELDEMWHYLEKKRKNPGSGKHFLLIEAGNLITKSAIVVLKP
ncbi:MAG: hypothetical protein SFU25_10055, partial [Candidatus Caenarcaniphilales bacterium]|nr:hypothetical protein [Candidatus Caenarcaniphilales bacterium]